MGDELLDKPHREKLYWWALLIYFLVFSFNGLATSTMAALIGTNWLTLNAQSKFMIYMAIAANWTGLILLFIKDVMIRLGSGKPPIRTGDTEQFTKGKQ